MYLRSTQTSLHMRCVGNIFPPKVCNCDTRNVAHIDQDIQSEGFPCLDFSGGHFISFYTGFVEVNSFLESHSTFSKSVTRS